MSIANGNITELAEVKIPVIDALYGGRFRIQRYFQKLERSASYDASVYDNYFQPFGTLDGAPQGTIPDSKEYGQEFANARLIEQSIMYFPNNPNPVLKKVYETLTNTLVDEQEPVTKRNEDGSEELTQTLVGTESADFIGTIGVTTHPDNPDLVLAGVETQIVNGKKTVVVKWVSAILKSHSRTAVSEGVYQHDYLWYHNTGAMVGNVVSRGETDPEGYKKISVRTLSTADDEPLTEADGSAKLVNRRKVEAMFRIPGTVRIETSPNFSREGHNHVLTAPVETKVLSDILVYYQKGSSVVAGDYLSDGAKGAWNPDEWANSKALIYSVGNPYFTSQSLRGYTSFQTATASDFYLDAEWYDGDRPVIEVEVSPNSVPVGTGYFAYGEVPYVHDKVTLTYSYGGGVVQYKFITVNKTLKFFIEEDSGSWKFGYIDSYTGPVFSYSTGGSLTAIDSARLGSVSTYNSPTSGAKTTIDTGTPSSVVPWDATWGSISLTGLKFGQEISVPGSDSINGHVVPWDTTGFISVSGGPEWPLGNRYVLNVSVERAFEEVSTGDVIYQKVVQVATITPI